MNEDKTHYLFVSCNDSKEYYPFNKAANFIVNLPIPLTLQDNWELGIVEFSYISRFTGPPPRRLYFCCGMVEASYTQGKLERTLRSFTVPSGISRIHLSFEHVIYQRLTSSFINKLHIYILDENLQEATLADDILNCTLHIRKIQ